MPGVVGRSWRKRRTEYWSSMFVLLQKRSRILKDKFVHPGHRIWLEDSDTLQLDVYHRVCIWIVVQRTGLAFEK